MTEHSESMRHKLIALYGAERGAACHARLMSLLDTFRAQRPDLSAQPIDPRERVTERDVMLITYGDSLQRPGLLPLQTLGRFLR
ncbi:MAG: alpha-amylase, partial [Chloroflexi bacterium]|nr:alpha-amylase [Chloroflexota bacterium]